MTRSPKAWLVAGLLAAGWGSVLYAEKNTFEPLPLPPQVEAVPDRLILPQVQFDPPAIPPLLPESVPSPHSEASTLPMPPAIDAVTPQNFSPQIALTPNGMRVTEEGTEFRYPDFALVYRENSSGSEVIPRDGTDGFGLTTLSILGSIQESHDGGGVWLNPAFEWTFLNGPVQPDLPPQLFELSLSVNVVASIGPLRLSMFVMPMLATDFDNTSSDAWRVVGGGIGVYELSPDWKLMGGVVLLDRPDLPVIPHAGLLFRPDGNIEIDCAIPRPRIALRVHGDEQDSTWIYLAGAIGGGSWAYERLDSSYDRLGYYDLRLLVGLDLRDQAGFGSQWELGYLFNRRLNLDRTGRTVDIPDGMVFRWSTSY